MYKVVVTCCYMNETQTLKSAVVKTLAIVGFLVTIGFIIYFVILGVKKAPDGISSLASIAETINQYRPQGDELTVATEKIVVNSEEQFQISWTDLQTTHGEYRFTYECTDGVHLSIRGADGTFIPMNCGETLTLPATVHGLFLSALSDNLRFSDVPLTISFVNADGDTTLSNTTKITVVNATIPSRNDDTLADNTPSTAQTPVETPAVTESVKIPTSTDSAVVSEITPPTQHTSAGYSDLSITALGSGVLTNGLFTYAQTFRTGLNNAVRFDVKNVGTQNSGAWSFKTILPTGEVYQSPIQAPLAPQAHVEFTLGFFLDGYTQSSAPFTHTLFIQGTDTNMQNNVVTQNVKVVK